MSCNMLEQCMLRTETSPSIGSVECIAAVANGRNENSFESDEDDVIEQEGEPGLNGKIGSPTSAPPRRVTERDSSGVSYESGGLVQSQISGK